MMQHDRLCQKEPYLLESYIHSHSMTADGLRDAWTLNQGPLTADRTGVRVEGSVDLTGVLNAIPRVEPETDCTVRQKLGGVMPAASVARKSYHDQWPLTTPRTACPAEAGRGSATLSMEAMQCPSIEENS